MAVIGYSVRGMRSPENMQPQDYNKIVTDFGEYNIYDVDRSVCDCIRFRKEMDEDIFGLILDSYRACRERQNNRILELPGDLIWLMRC